MLRDIYLKKHLTLNTGVNGCYAANSNWNVYYDAATKFVKFIFSSAIYCFLNASICDYLFKTFILILISIKFPIKNARNCSENQREKYREKINENKI